MVAVTVVPIVVMEAALRNGGGYGHKWMAENSLLMKILCHAKHQKMKTFSGKCFPPNKWSVTITRQQKKIIPHSVPVVAKILSRSNTMALTEDTLTRHPRSNTMANSHKRVLYFPK